MFVTAVPGLAPVVAETLTDLPGLTVRDTGFDGRSDVVLLDAARGHREEALHTGLTEDVFVEVGRTARADGDRAAWIAERIWKPERVQRALSVWADEVAPLSAGMQYRVIARVLQEQSFLRTELRRQLTARIAADRPKWRVADPARLEVWISEYAAGRFVAGLRLSDQGMRQHEGRTVEREGALRPTVAAAMVQLAGGGTVQPAGGGTVRPAGGGTVQPAGGEPGVLLDPCCGSGTILREATDAGWQARGVDIDPDAVAAAGSNAPAARIERGDARALTLADRSVDACVSNLPFGQQFTVQGDHRTWLRTVLGEMCRVTRPGGTVVLLVPDLPAGVLPAGLRRQRRLSIRLLGTRTALWVFRRND